GPGFAALLKLAASIRFDQSASGLDTLKYLRQNLFLKPMDIINGRIIPEKTGTHAFDDAMNSGLLLPVNTEENREQ
ncbi:MAG: hypothetical protein GY940_08050, partial [bacterium]|nr:hypothetical protein [bacterium]